MPGRLEPCKGRVYAYEDVRTFTFLRHAREAGFTLAQVRILLKARAGGASCVEVRNMASEHLEAVRLKIAQLVRLSERLQCAMSQCSTEPGGRCPVIEMLDCGPHGDRREYGSSTGLQQLNAAELTRRRLFWRELDGRDSARPSRRSEHTCGHSRRANAM